MMFFEIRGKHFVHDRLDRAFDFGVSKFRLGLTFELRLVDLH